MGGNFFTWASDFAIKYAPLSVPILLGVICLLLMLMGFFAKKFFKGLLDSLTGTKTLVEVMQADLSAFRNDLHSVKEHAVEMKNELKDDMHQLKDDVREVDSKVMQNTLITERCQSDICELEKKVSGHSNSMADLHQILKPVKKKATLNGKKRLGNDDDT